MADCHREQSFAIYVGGGYDYVPPGPFREKRSDVRTVFKTCPKKKLVINGCYIRLSIELREKILVAILAFYCGKKNIVFGF